MSSDHHDSSPPGALERTLLTAGRRDDRMPDVQRAWQRFASQVGTLAAATEPTSGLHLLSREAPPAFDPTARRQPVPAAPTAKTLWVAFGAIGGSALTATLFLIAGGRVIEASSPQAPTTTSTSASTSAADEVLAEPSAPSPPLTEGVGTAAVGTATVGTAAVGTATVGTAIETARVASAAPRARAAPRRTSKPPLLSIAAEVRALDMARAACKRGEYERCFLVVERFRQDHPKSALRPDAEVLAIEALAALGRTDAAHRRARAFLTRYPTDPHAQRVRALEQRTASE
jgi:hypothetical protein